MIPRIRQAYALLGLLWLLLAQVALAQTSGRQVIDLSSSNWKLWADRQAAWKSDALFLLPVDLSKLPVNPPTGGWQALDNNKDAVVVSVPGVAEEYLSDGFGAANRDNGAKALGVTWWWRDFKVPEFHGDKRVRLHFESTRLRAEVFLDQKLVGYHLVEGIPFDVDLTGLVRPGETHRLAVRITNPGGNYAWQDYDPIKWGDYNITGGRAFGGITGPVRLVITDSLRVGDVYVQNTPALRSVNAIVTVSNDGKVARSAAVRVRVTEKAAPGKQVFEQTEPARDFPAGDTVVSIPIAVADAKLWSPDHPELYALTVELVAAPAAAVVDSDQRVFGFRWFDVAGVGKDAIFRLNGHRIFLLSAISWGLWPGTGLVPTEAIAEKQIRAAKDFGLNMLNFHRAIGVPLVLNKADEMGLLYYAEPGGYRSAGADPFAREYARLKLLGMIKRDRSHPSLIIWNMINEYDNKDDAIYQMEKKDMAAAHAVDPSRIITLASGWASKVAKPEPVKLHMFPFDDRQYNVGWYDYHRAPGPATFSEDDYHSPTDNAFSLQNPTEILFWGEERAVSTPPRLALIKKELSAPGARPGWDGKVYLDWFDRFDRFLDEKKLRSAFPTVDSLTTAMGEVGLINQGRRIKIARMTNQTDGYVINGWDATVIDNHSGIVDAYRNPKADPSLIARYNQPAYVAVAPRTQVVETRDSAVVDIYMVNQIDLKGPYKLEVRLKSPAGGERNVGTYDVTLDGGDTFGQLLIPALKIPLTAADAGLISVDTTLRAPGGKAAATGSETLLAVDWRDDALSGRGAVYEWTPRVTDFLKKEKGIDVAAFTDQPETFDWIVVARPPQPRPELVPASALGEGIKAVISSGHGQPVERTEPQLNFFAAEGATPDPDVGSTNFKIKWTGAIVAPVTGSYIIGVEHVNGIDFRFGCERIRSRGTDGQSVTEVRRVELKAGEQLPFTIDVRSGSGDTGVKLIWSPPEQAKQMDPQRVIDRARAGATVIIADFADSWMDLIAKNTGVKYDGNFSVGANWTGGQFFVRAHPLFQGLPVNCALDWPYQRVVQRGGTRMGLNLKGEQFVVGAYNTWGFQLGTAVAVIPCGKGRIIVSTLDICSHLNEEDGPASVARKLLVNYIRYAAAGR